jgi:hypothetical protein
VARFSIGSTPYGLLLRVVSRTLGAGDELMLGESGVVPVAAYLCAAAIVLLALKFRWRDFAARHVNPA